MDGMNSWLPGAFPDGKYYVFNRIHDKRAYGNGLLKIYWIFVGVSDSLDVKLKHPLKLIFVNVYFK